jgi:hypothetical protein
MTDPRALVASLVFHAALLAVASILVFRSASLPAEETPDRTIHGELESTDNRAEGNEAGGGVGDPTNEGTQVNADKGMATAPTREPAADALLSEILPTRDSADSVSPVLPGPSTTGLSQLSPTGAGEGGGVGGGSGGGVGSSNGPGTEFFGIRDRGGSFAYVIDCSGSMLAKGSLEVAKRELLASLAQLSADARFAVVFYNTDAKVFTDPDGRQGLMAATPGNKTRVRSLLSGVLPNGGTDHKLALRTALAMKPEVIFFLTDADWMARDDVEEILAIRGQTRIRGIEFGLVSALGGSSQLKALTKATGGSYRYINVSNFDAN